MGNLAGLLLTLVLQLFAVACAVDARRVGGEPEDVGTAEDSSDCPTEPLVSKETRPQK